MFRLLDGGDVLMAPVEIFYSTGGQSESWLTVLDDGTIRYHWDLDGHAFMRDGSQPIDVVIPLEDALRRWPQYKADILKAIKASSHV
jgi:hypothetical protein